jgi:hypothetical protein
MPYNTELENRLDHLIPQPERFEKKKMFGGVGYLLMGKMTFGIHKQYLIVRASPEQTADWLKNGSALPFDITGRPMKGWVMFPPEKISGDQQISDLIDISLEFVRTLPDK